MRLVIITMSNNPKSKPRKARSSARSSKRAGVRRTKSSGTPLYKRPEREQPAAMSRIIRSEQPAISSLKNGGISVSHREYIGDLKSGTGVPSAFLATVYPLNPGQASLFPWLSKIAANYESYSFNSVRITYEPQAPTTSYGTVILTVDFDAKDDPPANKQQALLKEGAVRAAPWQTCSYIAKPSNLHKAKTNLVRPGAQPSDTDIREYDIGNLFLCSSGVSTASIPLGDVYIEYSIVLTTPTFETPPALLNVGGYISGGTSTVPLAPFGITPVVDGKAEGITMTYDVKENLLYIEQAGDYLVDLNSTGTNFVANGAHMAVYSPGSTAAKVRESQAAGVSVSVWLFTVPSGATPGVFSPYHDFTGATTISSSELYVASAPIGSLV